MTDLPAASLLERPCRPCQEGEHADCLIPFTAEYGMDGHEVVECCCDDLDRDPDPPRWHP